ncbi:pentapeptide repeat-containing protein [Streptomyces sp. NBC_01230]|uniref:pentapeptide repeat-containing protein n=1 Tax=Streptomyces sp. NBC_01230 TaxID=2903784 RepID=UPI002E1540D3|nr:pentapeptide repeat-containing protein [Streptomyces sp. NBC_01230]
MLGTTAVTAAISLSMWGLLAQTNGLNGAARATARLDAIKTALTVGAGIGGAVALLLTLRRQWLSEHEQIHREEVDASTEHDATERRITELYTAAASQLGGDTAPGRLAGLYALERLAQDHTAHRQTIVNVICAYLRMPFEPEPPSADMAAWSEERVVRLTAQQILTDHLIVSAEEADEWLSDSPSADPKFWPGIELNLAGATLLHFEFAMRRAELVNFHGTRFVGYTNSSHAELAGHAYFHRARFEGGAGNFRGAWFGLRVVFSGADFGEHRAAFDGATFAGMVFLKDATFGSGVSLDDARALADFNTNWGSERQWPPGWRERPITENEPMPRPRLGRWTRAAQPTPGDETWTVLVRDEPGQAPEPGQ